MYDWVDVVFVVTRSVVLVVLYLVLFRHLVSVVRLGWVRLG